MRKPCSCFPYQQDIANFYDLKVEGSDEKTEEIEAASGRKKGDFFAEVSLPNCSTGYGTVFDVKCNGCIQLAGRAALGRNGRPEEIASLVAYLVSEEAHFITGK